MNKLFKKIATLSVGLAMAIGVGVVAGSDNKSITKVSASSVTINWNSFGITGTALSRTETTSGYSVNISSVSTNGVAKNGTIHNQVAIPSSITSITVNGAATKSTKTDGTFTVYGGTSKDSITTSMGSVSGLSSTAQNKTVAFTGSYTFFKITVGSARTLVFTSIVINYSDSFTLSFDANGGTGTVPSSITGTGSKTLPSSASITRTGYTLDGWGESAHKDDATAQYALGASYTLSSTVTLYAHWTPTTYAIYYVLDGGSHGTTHPSSGTYDTAFYVSAPSKTGYTFTGWTVTSGLNSSTAKWGTTSSPSTAISSTSTLCVNGASGAVYFKNINAESTAVTLTANWSIVSYSVNGGSTTTNITNGSLSSAAPINHGSALSISLIPASDYKLPASLTSVTMGGTPLSSGDGIESGTYSYNSSNGAIGISSVTGNIVITATCPINATTYTISVTSISNGTSSGDTGEQVEHGDYAVQLTPNTLYKYPESISIDGAGDEDNTEHGWKYSSSDGIVHIYDLTDDVEISAICGAASITSISVTGQKTAFTLGDAFSFDGTVKANYDDAAGTTDHTISTDLVNVDSTAYNAFEEANSEKTTKYYTINVSLKSNSSIKTSYNVTVTKKSISYTITWVLVEEDLDDFTGEYIILNTGNNYYPTTSIDGSGRAVNGTPAPTVTNKVISNDDVTSAMIWIINKEGDFETEGDEPETINYYSIKNKADNKYLISGSNQKLSFPTTLSDPDATNYDYEVWQIAYGSALDIYNQGLESGYYLRCNGTYGWRCYASGTGTKPVLYKKVETPSTTKSLIRITATGPDDNAKKEGDILTGADFTTTALYDTGETDNTITATVVSGGTLVAGSNTVGLSYTESGVTKTCEVTVVAAENTAELDGIIWSQSGTARTVFNGSAIGSFGTLQKHFDDESTLPLNISDCTVAIYNNTSGSKAHDVADPTAYTWNLTNDNGKYIGVTFDEYTVYSGVITVVKTINDVFNKNKVITWSKVTSINAGDVVTFVNETSSKVASSHSSNIINASSYNTTITEALSFEVGTAKVGDNTYYTFHNEGGYLGNHSTGTSGSNYAYLDANIDTSTNQNYFTVSFDSGNVIIQSVYASVRKLYFNSTRFCFYGNAQSAVQLYKGTTSYVPYGDNIANTNANAQIVVLEYAEHFNNVMNCINDGSTATVSSKWSSLSTDFTNWFTNATKGLTEEEKIHAKALFAGANAVDGGDDLQDMLARYEYICAKYKLDDFLHDEADRPPVPQRGHFSPFLSILSKNPNVAAIVIVTSIISVAAIGGYFFLRKKKED